MTEANLKAGLKAYGAARRTQTPVRIVVELFDAVLCAVAKAKAARLMKNYEDEFNAVCRANQILAGLDSVVDENQPKVKPIAEILHNYYALTVEQLHRAKQTKGEEGESRYGSVHRQILTMREAWAWIAGVPSLLPESGKEEKSA